MNPYLLHSKGFFVISSAEPKRTLSPFRVRKIALNFSKFLVTLGFRFLENNPELNSHYDWSGDLMKILAFSLLS